MGIVAVDDVALGEASRLRGAVFPEDPVPLYTRLGHFGPANARGLANRKALPMASLFALRDEHRRLLRAPFVVENSHPHTRDPPYFT